MNHLISFFILTILAVALSRVKYLSAYNLRTIKKCLAGDCKHGEILEVDIIYEARQDLEKALKGGKK